MLKLKMSLVKGYDKMNNYDQLLWKLTQREMHKYHCLGLVCTKTPYLFVSVLLLTEQEIYKKARPDLCDDQN